MRTLVAGIGNIFLGDDGFGVEVAKRLGLADYGIRGVHLAYELLEGYDALVLIDAMPMGEAARHRGGVRAGHRIARGGAR